MRLVAATLTAAALVLCSPALAENYGGVSAATSNRMVRIIRLWFPRDAGTMVCIMDRESGRNPRAYNDDFYPRQSVAGLLQIAWPDWTPGNPQIWRDARYGSDRNRGLARGVLRFWHHRTPSWGQFKWRMFDPVQNARLGHLLYHYRGLADWTGHC